MKVHQELENFSHYCRRLVSAKGVFLPQARSRHILVDTVALEQVAAEALRFSPFNYRSGNTPHSFVCHPGAEKWAH
jgi:hypothetical protein